VVALGSRISAPATLNLVAEPLPVPLADDEMQLALYLAYEVHYRGLAGVPDESSLAVPARRRRLRSRRAVAARAPVAAVAKRGLCRPGRSDTEPSRTSVPGSRLRGHSQGMTFPRMEGSIRIGPDSGHISVVRVGRAGRCDPDASRSPRRSYPSAGRRKGSVAGGRTPASRCPSRTLRSSRLSSNSSRASTDAPVRSSVSRR
jgi:hypothetical protein